MGKLNKTEELKNNKRRTPSNYSKMPVKGEKISGQIIDVQHNKVAILMENGEVVEARLTKDLQFVIGDQVKFLVKDLSDGQLLLQPIDENKLVDDKLLSILKVAGFEDTPKNRELLGRLIEKSMPIDKSSLQEMVMYTKRFPEAKVNELVFLKENDILISKESLHYVEQLLNHKQSVSSNISNFNNEVASIIDKTSGAMVAKTILRDNEPAVNVLTKIRNFFFKPDNQVEVPAKKLELPMNKLMTQASADQVVNNAGKILLSGLDQEHYQSSYLSELSNLSVNKEKAFSQLFSAIENLDVPEDIKQATNKLIAGSMTKSMLNHELMFKKDEIESVDTINKHYNKVYSKMVDVLNLDLHDNSETVQQVLKEAGNIKTSVELMNQLQENHQFLHIPMIINNQNVDSELYVMKKNSGKKKQSERITALLRLDLRNLGQLDIYIAKTGNNVDVNFYTVNEEVTEHIRKHAGDLYKQLIEKSFNVLGIGASLREKEFNIVDDFLEPNDSGESKRFSFDMRA